MSLSLSPRRRRRPRLPLAAAGHVLARAAPIGRRAARARPTGPDPSRRVMAVKLTAARPTAPDPGPQPDLRGRWASEGLTRGPLGLDDQGSRASKGLEGVGGQGAGGPRLATSPELALRSTATKARGLNAPWVLWAKGAPFMDPGGGRKARASPSEGLESGSSGDEAEGSVEGLAKGFFSQVKNGDTLQCPREKGTRR